MAKFVKGQSGNPGGRKKKELTIALESVLAEKDPATKKTKMVLVARALVDKAIDGDVPAIKEIWERLEGKVAQAVVGDPEQPIKIVHTFESSI